MEVMTDDIERTVAVAQELLAPVMRAPLRALRDEEVCALAVAVEQLGRLVDALRVSTAGELAERSRFELGTESVAYRLGRSTAANLVEFLTRVAPAEAKRRVKLGLATRERDAFGAAAEPPYPAVASALERGQVGLDSAAIIVRCLDEAGRMAPADEVAVAERELVDAATTATADEVGVQARVWREALDPDGAEPREEALRRKRSFRLLGERNGMTRFAGACDPSLAALLRSAFHEADRPGSTPRFVDDDDLARGTLFEIGDDGETRSVFTDPRTRDQRHFDVLDGLVRAGVRATGTESGGMRSTARISVVVTLDDLLSGRGVAWLEAVDEPISAAAVQELVCSNGMAVTILGRHGEPLYQGDDERLFTEAQKRALAVRDGGCLWPGCRVPAGQCDAHHVIEASRGGPTDIDNGVLLCSRHHRMLHHSDFTMRMQHGRPHLLAPPWVDPAQSWVPLGKSRLERQRALRKRRRC
jgi:DNA-binding transcriptional ArsR family regulator